MTYKINEDLNDLLNPDALLPVKDVLADRTRIPAQAGVYGWWFRDGPPMVPLEGTVEKDGYRLLYVGIAPRRPSRAGSTSNSTLRQRLAGNHLGGSLSSSTVRRTLAALLQDELGLQVGRRASGKLVMPKDNERKLTDWMADHAALSLMASSAPWQIEDALLRSDLRLPLNLAGSSHAFRPTLSSLRSKLAA